MNNYSKKILKTILAIIVLISISATSVFADNETTTEGETETTQTNTQTNSTPETATQEETTSPKNSEVQSTSQEETNNNTQVIESTPTEQAQQEEIQTNQQTSITRNTNETLTKSSNANLSNLGITPNDFSGFRESITSYTVSVPNTVKEVEVYATKKDNRATITGTGKVQLKEGNNVANVVVTAEDGTTKTYTINIKRLKQGETAETTLNTDLWLENIEIEGYELDPGFNKDTHKYTVTIQGSIEKLNIKTQANNPNANIKIFGNERLINGQNIITILVSENDGDGVITYQIYANKNLVEQDELNKHINDAETKYRIKQIIIIVLIVIITIGIITLIVLIYKKSKNPGFKKEKISKKQKNTKSGRHSK